MYNHKTIAPPRHSQDQREPRLPSRPWNASNSQPPIAISAPDLPACNQHDAPSATPPIRIIPSYIAAGTCPNIHQPARALIVSSLATLAVVRRAFSRRLLGPRDGCACISLLGVVRLAQSRGRRSAVLSAASTSLFGKAGARRFGGRWERMGVGVVCGRVGWMVDGGW